VEKRVTKGRKMRMDTTVVEAAIRYPTDSGLCEAAIRVLGRALRRLAAAGVRLPFVLRNASRSVARRMKEIGQALRTRGKCAKKKALEKPYRRLLRVTGRVVRQAERATEAARKQMARLDRTARRVVERIVAHIEKMAPRARQVLRQTRARIVRGVTNSSGKLLSLFETKAQIHRRGKLRRPTEFGALVLVQEAEGGIVTDIGVVAGKADAPLLVPAVQRHVEVFGRAPDVVAVDRGFYSSDGERRIQELGVRHAVVPKPGGRSRVRLLHERQRWFRRGRAWRAGSEGRISRLKNGLGMARSRYRGDDGTDRTAYWAGIANNLLAIAARSA
jgi:IS5 family transposase